MRLKKYISAILISILICSLSGCGKKKIEVTINPEINEYSSWMSSTPGIPLTAKLKGKTSEDNIKFHWVTEQGTFLTWQQDTGKISVLGKDIKINEQKIYWSIDPNEKINEPSFKIYLKIEDNVTSEVIGETSIEVEQNKGVSFSIKK